MKTSLYCFIVFLFTGCVASKDPRPKKYGRDVLLEDYSIFKNALEESHPGLYWYTPKDSIDNYFRIGESMIKDSMREVQFKNVLSYVLSNVRCGHTTARMSNAPAPDSLRNRSFPLYIKFWKDTAVLLQSIVFADNKLTRGALIKSIDGKPMQFIVDSLFRFLSADGYNETHKYQTLSNPGTFSTLFLNVFGYKNNFQVGYADTAGIQRTATIPLYIPPRDTTKKKPEPKISRKQKRTQRLLAARRLTIDSTLNTAIMDLNTFTRKNNLRSFFRTSFRTLKKKHVENLVINLRINGGGSVNNSNLLTKYIADHRFKIGDSLYSITRKSSYKDYQKGYLWNHLFMLFFTKKKKDGNYHFTYFENKTFRPKATNHFDGKVYVLTGGYTFSASTLFAEAVREQENVIIVGEETGGGAYGNNAWIIPDMVLPNTKVRFRLPLFRLVIDKDQPKGYGVQPEIFAGPTIEAIKKGVDYKMDVVRKLILADKKK